MYYRGLSHFLRAVVCVLHGYYKSPYCVKRVFVSLVVVFCYGKQYCAAVNDMEHTIFPVYMQVSLWDTFPKVAFMGQMRGAPDARQHLGRPREASTQSSFLSQNKKEFESMTKHSKFIKAIECIQKVTMGNLRE